MATDLERFRDHCRTMADSTPDTRVDVETALRMDAEQVRTRWKVGAISDAERALWRTLADDVDRYLSAAGESVDHPMF